ncbi:DUF883 family protein [Ramlibacter humi]|uniref:DUF883 domain-containing protein n=1 Tax=Ramlibacter humi TaxID=2530451 RepID=A0A4Z0BI79_9BURK|nr:DUF883 family protein [Ramlibacter humi]TFY97598.1 DUF883 domain-containing protein [Ramlibacter humi]
MNDTTPNGSAPISSPRDRLMADLKVVIADAEELLKMTAGQAGDKAADVRQRIQQRLDSARADLSRVQEQALSQAKEAGRAADQYVHENPWTAVGIGAGVGLLLGLLIGGRR